MDYETRSTFLNALAENGVVAYACTQAKITYAEFRRMMEADTKFTQEVEDAKTFAEDMAELELRNRAVHGEQKPLMYRGEPVFKRHPNTGELILDDDFEPIPVMITEKSNRLLEVYMKAHKKEYRNSTRQARDPDDPDNPANRLPSSISITLVQSDGNGGMLEHKPAEQVIIDG